MMENEKTLGADAAAVVNAEPVVSDQLAHAAPAHTPGPWTIRATALLAKDEGKS